MSFNMYIPTRMHFGAGALNQLSKVAMPGKKAMIIISNGKTAHSLGYLSRVELELEKLGIPHAVFDKVEANPTRNSVMLGGAFARTNGCDFIIALGGGSVMDAAKAIATVATNHGDLWLYAGGKTGQGMPIIHQPLPIIAITTTAGTGSEVDQWGVITKTETNEKIGFGGLDSHFPVVAIIDPELMLSVPPTLTAFQGFDALFHSVECYISKNANLMSDMYALTAIENVTKYLPGAIKNGADLEAREHVAFANTLSGVVMTISSCTSEHSMEHAMSAYHPQLAHGAGLIMLSLAYYQFFIDNHACDSRFITMAQAMGMKNAQNPQDFITALADLQAVCGVSTLKMSDYGISQDQFDTLAANARDTMGGLFLADPCPMSHQECVDIFAKSFH